MKGYVALTDNAWYSFLQRGEWEEVNFWQPGGGTLLNPPIGMPFFFKLHASHGSRIVGFGHFAWRSHVPAWMAWDSFQAANGASDRESFLTLLARRRRETVDRSGSFTIGCLLISRPVFFPPEASIRPPEDWPRSGIQQGKSYDLSQGEGLRLYTECLSQAARYPEGIETGAGASPHGTQERFGSPYLTRSRLGQGGFRLVVTDAYGRSCAVTTERSLPVLDAVHIRPYADGGEHEASNGLLLRTDIHRLYDQGLVTVTPDYQFLVSHRLEKDYKNGRTYYELQRKLEQSGGIRLPANSGFNPSRELLGWHVRERFLG